MGTRIKSFTSAIAVCWMCGAHGAAVDILTEPRFPTENHRKYPLALVSENVDGVTIYKCQPYVEPAFVQPMTQEYDHFRALTFPLPDAETDEVRYFAGLSFLHGTIPQGTQEVEAGKVGQTYLWKFVYSNGRVKNVYGIPKAGPPELEFCVYYNDQKRLAIRGSIYKNRLSEAQIYVYPPGAGPLDVKAMPIRTVHFHGRLEYSLWEGGRETISVAVPQPLTIATGKLPCQAPRYIFALKNIVDDRSFSDDEKVTVVLRFMQLEPVKNEEESAIDGSYSSLRWFGISLLRDFRCAAAFDALVHLLDDDRLCAEAAGALGKRGDPTALPHLVGALEREDRKRKGHGHLRNGQMTTCAIVEAMFRISPTSAGPLVEEFVKPGNRLFAETIEGIRDQKLTGR